jgi:hypothetical protein
MFENKVAEKQMDLRGTRYCFGITRTVKSRWPKKNGHADKRNKAWVIGKSDNESDNMEDKEQATG